MSCFEASARGRALVEIFDWFELAGSDFRNVRSEQGLAVGTVPYRRSVQVDGRTSHERLFFTFLAGNGKLT